MYWLFLGPALIHIWWGVCACLSARPLATTGLWDLNAVLGGAVGPVLIAIGLLSVAAVPAHWRKYDTAALLLLLPQQAAMLISASTVGRCISESRFADGLPYDPLFISADQCYILIIGLMHTGLLLEMFVLPGLSSFLRPPSQTTTSK